MERRKTGAGLLSAMFVLALVVPLAMVLTFEPVAAQSWTDNGGGDHGGTDWIITTSGTIADNHYNIRVFKIAAGVTVTVKAWDNTGGQNKWGWVEIHADNIVIEGTLSANGAGYAGGAPGENGKGLGGGTHGTTVSTYAGSTSTAGGGGGYGASGGKGADGYGAGTSGVGGPSYGVSGLSTYPPSADDIQMGSGGGGTGAIGRVTAWGGSGGGAVLLFAEDVTITGSIVANGNSGGGGGYGGGTGGGGSGGGILTVGYKVNVTGSLSVAGGNGGYGAWSGCDGGGGGSGGRIKIFWENFLNVSSYNVAGGAGGHNYYGMVGQSGGTGTYFQSKINFPHALSPWCGGQTNPQKVTDLTPEFSAIHLDNGGDKANKYRIQVSTDSTFASVTHWDSGAAGTAMVMTDNGVRCLDITYGSATALSRVVMYYWRIKFWDTLGLEGLWSATQNFRLNQLPAASALLTGGQTGPTRLTTFTPIFSWTYSDPDGDAQSQFMVEVWTGADGTGTLIDNSYETAGVGTSYTYGSSAFAETALSRGVTYHWRVRTKDNTEYKSVDNAWGGWATGTFRLQLPNSPTGLLTDGWEARSKITPKFSAIYTDNIAGVRGDNIQIQVGTDEGYNDKWDSGWVDIADLDNNTRSENVSYNDSTLTRATTYYWRCRFKDNTGGEGYWSDSASFKVNQIPVLSGLLIDGQASPASITKTTPKFTWNFGDADGDSQLGIAIQVGTSENGSDMWNYWDTTTTAQEKTYAGSVLSLGVNYYVRIRARDNFGEWAAWENGISGSFAINALPVVSDLKTEEQTNPQNITDNTPEFTWTYSDSDEEPQSHYQVWVGTNFGANDKWDSGAVDSDNKTAEYAGKALTPGVTYFVQVRAKDGVQWGGWATGTFRINAPPVTQSIKINNDNNYTNSMDVTLTLSASDDVCLENMAFSFDGSSWTAWEPYATSKSLPLLAGDGVKCVYFKVQDSQGWESSVISDTIILDMTKPYGMVGVSPAENAVMGPTTVRFYWTLARDDVSGAVSVYTFKLAKDEDFTEDLYTATTVKEYIDFPYDNRAGASYWQVRVCDRAGNEENTPAYRFVYDPNAPSLTVNAEKTVLNTLGAQVTLSGSNITAYRYAFAEADLDDADWVSYTGAENTLTISLPAEEGQYRVYFEAISEAGVTAGPLTVPILLDFTPPQLTLTVDNLASMEPTRTLGFTADDGAGSGVREMRVKIGGENWGPWENYDETKIIELESEGITVVQVQLCDLAGNESAVQSLSLFYSTRPPQLDLQVPAEVSERTYILKIPASPGVRLFVNGEEVQPNANGYFEKELLLREGQNEFSIVARDLAGNSTEETITITYAAEVAPGVGSEPLLLGAIIAAISAAGVGAFLMFRRRRMMKVMLEREERRIEPKAVKPFVKPKRPKRPKVSIKRRGRVVRPFAEKGKKRKGA